MNHRFFQWAVGSVWIFGLIFGSVLYGANRTAERDESALLTKIATLPVVQPGMESIPGFTAFGGHWTVTEEDGENVATVDAGPGWRLVPTDKRFEKMVSGEMTCELFIPEAKDGFSGINFKVSDSDVGANAFNGYEVGINPKAKTAQIGAHRHNFEPYKTVPFDVPIRRWFTVGVRFDETSFTVFADGKELFTFRDDNLKSNDPLRCGTVGLRSWEYPLRFRNLAIRSFDGLADTDRESAVWTKLEFQLAETNMVFPETLLTDDLPPILVLIREPLGRPNSVGNDIWMAQPTGPGSEIRLVDPANPARPVTTIFSDPDMVIYDMNLSFDAETIFFSAQKFGEKFWHLWKIRVDGTDLTQLTDGEFYDISPCELPDGNLVFVSTRRFGHTVCQPGPASNLFTIRLTKEGSDPDSIHCVSMDTLSDMTPQILPDGRVLFSRWEYIDRDLTYRQSLWTQNPDGTGYQLYFGNTIRDVGSFLQARPFPGNDSSRVIAAFTPHHNWPRGAIGEIDRSAGVEGEKGKGFIYWSREITSVQDQPIEWGYCHPYPVADDVTLCAYGADNMTAFTPGEAKESGRFKIWLLDKEGNRRLVYEDAQKSCFSPILLEERERPSEMTSRIGKVKRAIFRPTLTSDQLFSEWEKTAPAFANRKNWGIPEQENPLVASDDGLGDPTATVVLVDVYNGLSPKIERGSVKKLRIMEQVRKTEDLVNRAYDQSPVMSYGTYYAKRCWGEVPVEADGSAHFYAPALREVYFQALDAEGKEIQRMTSGAQFMAGETISCMGCHEPRETVTTASTESAHRPTASSRAPSLPILPAGMENLPKSRTNPRLDAGIVDYPSVVQPILDRYCVACHSGTNPDGGYDLSGDVTRFFSMSYDNLLGRSQSYRQYEMASGETMKETERLEKPLVQFYWLLYTPTGINPEMKAGTHASRLADYFTADHCGVEVPDDAKRLVWLWIDANAPYYGTFANSRPETWGKRDLWTKLDENVFAPWFAEVVKPIYESHCAECHNQYERPRWETAPVLNEATTWDGKFAWINLSRPENSVLLTAHLSKSAGGRGISTDPHFKGEILFHDTSDPVYQKLLDAIQTGAEEAKKRSRADQRGFAGARPEP